MSDMETLFPGREITVAGETLRIAPLRFGQIAEAGKKLAPVIKAIALSPMGKTDQSIMDMAADWVEVLASGGEELLTFLAWSVGKPREWFDTIGMDDGIAILQAVYGENLDFFNRRVLPLLARAQAENQQIGVTSSESLSPPVTDGQTSTATP